MVNEAIAPTTKQVYDYLSKRSQVENGSIEYNREQFLKDLGLKAEQIHQSLEELRKRELIIRQATKGRTICHLVPTPREDVQSVMADQSLSPIEELLLAYIFQNQPLKYQVTTISEESGISATQVRKGVQRLLALNKIEKRGLSNKGDCLMLPSSLDEDSLLLNEFTPPMSLSQESSSESYEAEPLIQSSSPTIYLVDTENGVSNEENFQRLSQLNQKDLVLLFLSQHSSWFNHPKRLNLILDAKANLPIIKSYYTETEGKNAMDFIIAAKVGFLLAQDQTQSICIISKDRGFDAVIRQLTEEFELPQGQLSRKEQF